MARRNPSAGLFNGYWLTPEGKKIRRVGRDKLTGRSEWPTIYRLWHEHTAIRLGITTIGSHNHYPASD